MNASDHGSHASGGGSASNAGASGFLGTLFLTVFIDLVGFGLVVPFLPGLARDLGATPFVATLTGTAYSLMQFLFVPIWGRLSDRVGRRPVLLTSIAATALGMAALGFADSLIALFAARLFSGAATANIAVAQAYIADRTPPERRARGMGLIGMAFGLGFILGPFIGGELAQFPLFGRPNRLPAFVAAAMALVNLALAARTLPESLPRERRGMPVEAPRALGVALFRGARPSAELMPALLTNFLLVFWFAGMEQTFRLFTEDAYGWSIAATGRIFGLIGLVLAATQGGLVGRLTPRFGEARLVSAGLAIQVIGFALLGFAPQLPARTLMLAIASSAIALGIGLVNPSLSSYVSRRAGAGEQGATLGRLQSTGALARVWGPVAGGALYQGLAPTAPYIAGAAGMLLAIVVWARSARQNDAIAP